jgi:hypothetical protein
MKDVVNLQALYCLGCDMGGWHNDSDKAGDVFAALKWGGHSLHHIEATAALSFFPVDGNSVVRKCLDAAKNDSARIVIGIDAALAWPYQFRRLVAEIPDGMHDFAFQLGKAIDNPYLYSQTERFIKQRVRIGSKEQPRTAVGDKFGNNSSKKPKHLRLGLNSICPICIGRHSTHGIEVLPPSKKIRSSKFILQQA